MSRNSRDSAPEQATREETFATPEYWRRRAEELRAHALNLRHPLIRRAVLALADRYDAKAGGTAPQQSEKSH